ncbi:MAG: DNA adenine methylase [Bacteroidetes bacterium]|nr:DNA adenine methylase [Bacteroidota bacterium]
MKLKNIVRNAVSETQLEYGVDFQVKQTLAKPFVKWAGGKGQLIETLRPFFPDGLSSGKIKKYVEPFIGGGALFFYIAQNYHQIEEFFISDLNPELILTYQVIKRNAADLILLLSGMEIEYHNKNREEQKSFFYALRGDFNAQLAHFDFENFNDKWVERAAKIIFLNRTCFNGLFRVNSKGEFNVPFGDYKNPRICDFENLQAVSSILQRAAIICGDFTKSKDFVDSETFVYFDPPYRPISKTSSFTSYSRFEFDDSSQRRLAEYFRILSKTGAKLMMSNSDPKNENINDNFFEDTYQGYEIQRIDANRMINCDGEKRGKIKEIIVMNY